MITGWSTVRPGLVSPCLLDSAGRGTLQVPRGRSGGLRAGCTLAVSRLLRASCRFFLAASAGVSQSVAFALGFQDMAAVREPVERSASEPLAAEYLGPVLEWQVRGHDQALPLVGGADDVKQQLLLILLERNMLAASTVCVKTGQDILDITGRWLITLYPKT